MARWGDDGQPNQWRHPRLSTARADRTNKGVIFQDERVPEYWIVDPAFFAEALDWPTGEMGATGATDSRVARPREYEYRIAPLFSLFLLFTFE
jgi:hypothetical protein